MAKLLAYYNLCPINNVEEFLGLSKDAEPGCVINTLGRNIILVVKLSNQKQLCSWTALDRLTSNVVYDFKTKKYVGIFANRYLRGWSRSQDDINKVKKIKFHRHIVGLYTTPDDNTLVLYENGNCESLESALENRETNRKSPQDVSLVISKVQLFKVLGNEIMLTYFVQNEEENFTEFRYIILDKETLKPTPRNVWRIKVHRSEQNVNLIGCTVVDSTPNPSLLSIWSDSRIFMESLKFDVTPNEIQMFSSTFVSMLSVVSVEKPLSLIGIGKDMIAVYGNNTNQDGASLFLYNTNFKVFQAKQFFKVYFSNSKFWICENNILLACGQSLCVLPFRISKEQLADMIGSQISENLKNVIDNESINEDCEFDDGYEYEGPVKVVDFKEIAQKTQTTPIKRLEAPESFYEKLHELCRKDVTLEIVRDEKLPAEMVQMKLFSNVDNQLGTLTMDEHFEYFVSDLEKYGASEMEITEKLIPILMKTNSTLDIGKCLKRYNNISEKMIVQVLKYILEIPAKNGEESENDQEMREPIEQNSFSKSEFPNRNIFLRPPSKEQIDLLNIILSCSFNRDSILPHIRKELTLTMAIQLLRHLYELLMNEDDFLLEIPSNCEDFDNDEKVVEWATLLIDSHYQQFVLSRDDSVLEEICRWQEIVDRHMKLLNELKELHPVIVSVMKNKNKDNENKFCKWYSIEAMKLY